MEGVGFETLVDDSSVREVRADKMVIASSSCGSFFEDSEPCLFDSHVVVSVDNIKCDNAVAALEKMLCRVKTNKPGSTGD